MTEGSGLHAYTAWARSRLDEMDAVIDEMETKSAEMQEQSRQSVSQVMDELKRYRSEFEAKAKEAQAGGEAAWEASHQQLDSLWNGFESGLDAWVQTAENQSALYEARARAQLAACQSMIEDYTRQAALESVPQ